LPQGIPLRCIACNVLLLNRVTYLQHTTSKVRGAGANCMQSIMFDKWQKEGWLEDLCAVLLIYHPHANPCALLCGI
jgi:hypothetical protein